MIEVRIICLVVGTEDEFYILEAVAAVVTVAALKYIGSFFSKLLAKYSTCLLFNLNEFQHFHDNYYN